MPTPINSTPLAGFWKKLSGSIAAAGQRSASPIAVVSIRHGEDTQSEELIGALLAFAQTHGLGVEHNLIKNRLVFYRDANAPAESAPQAPQPDHPNVLAFPMARVKGNGR